MNQNAFTRAPLRRSVLALLAICGSLPLAAAERGQRIVEATYKLTDGQTAATCFLVERPKPDNVGNQILLVTAAHVLENFKGDVLTLNLRHVKSPEEILPVPTPVGIRKDGKLLWTRHPDTDVAVIAVPDLADFRPATLPLDILATDETWKKFQFEPGDIVRMVGYPHAMQFEPNPLGYPTTRLGALAGFPLKPTAKARMFNLDANIFEGDSGGPIYFLVDKPADGGPRPLVVLGLLHGQHFINESFRTVYQSGEVRHRFGLGIGIHASAIRETVEKVPID